MTDNATEDTRENAAENLTGTGPGDAAGSTSGNLTGLDERWATVAGREVRYLVGGQGKPLVLCHGFLSSAEEFGGRFSALASKRTLIVPDLPGNAWSAPLQGRHTAEAMAACVDELLRQLGVDEFDLGGLCLGASVAAALARRRPASVGRLVLHTPLLAPGLVRARYRYQVRLLTLPGPWGLVLWVSRQRRLSDLYKRYVIREGPIDPATSDINFENQRRAYPQAAREWIRDALDRDDLALIAERTEPTLIIVVQNDNLVNVEGVHRLVEGLSGVTLFVDEEGGHGWSETAVRRHLAVLQKFFAERSSEPEPAGVGGASLATIREPNGSGEPSPNGSVKVPRAGQTEPGLHEPGLHGPGRYELGRHEPGLHEEPADIGEA